MWTNCGLTFIACMPLYDWKHYQYAWTPTFIHIWHAKFFFLILFKNWLTAREGKNDAMSYRTKAYYDTVDLVLNVLSCVFTAFFIGTCLIGGCQLSFASIV
jgi:hypothetical protein